MFTHNTVIDLIQDSKKKVVSALIKDDKFKEELNKLIDAQAAAAKTSVEASLAIAQSLVKNSSTLFKMPAAK